MSSSARKKLQSLFIDELEELRTSARDFQSDFPLAASNLSLEEGKVQGPPRRAFSTGFCVDECSIKFKA